MPLLSEDICALNCLQNILRAREPFEQEQSLLAIAIRHEFPRRILAAIDCPFLPKGNTMQ